jgi:hypothetical protein
MCGHTMKGPLSAFAKYREVPHSKSLFNISTDCALL